MNIGLFITKECTKRKISIKDYAKKCGVTPDYIHKLKKNPTISPTLETYKSFAKGFDMSLKDFLTGIGEINDNDDTLLDLQDSRIFLITINRFLKKANIDISNLTDEQTVDFANYILNIFNYSYHKYIH